MKIRIYILLFLFVGIKTQAQHFYLDKVFFSNLKYTETKIEKLYRQESSILDSNYLISSTLIGINKLAQNIPLSLNDSCNNYLLLAYTNSQISNYNSAIKNIIKAELIAKKLNNTSLVNNVNVLLALTLNKQQLFKKSNEVLLNVTEIEPLSDFLISCQIAYNYQQQENYKSSNSIFQKNLSFAIRTSGYDHYKLLSEISKNFTKIKDYNSALIYQLRADSLLNPTIALSFNPKIDYKNVSKKNDFIANQKIISKLNLSAIHRKQNNFEKSIEIINGIDFRKVQNPNLKALIYVSLGLSNTFTKNYIEATSNYSAAQVHFKNQNRLSDVANTLNLLAKNYFLNREDRTAINNCQESIAISSKQDDYENLCGSYLLLTEIYSFNNDFYNSQKYFKLYSESKSKMDNKSENDITTGIRIENETSVLYEQIKKEIVELENKTLEFTNTKILNEKKESELLLLKKDNELKEQNIKNQELEKEQIQKTLLLIKRQLEKEKLEKENVILTLEKDKKSIEEAKIRNKFALLSLHQKEIQRESDLKNLEIERNNKQRKTLFAIIGMFILITLVISFLLYNNYKQKKIIKQFSENLEEKNMKLNTSLTEISVQKKIIEEASLQITDSINYASKLQTSLLPKLNEIKANFSDFFLLNLPKNIVSGDISFYKSTNLFDYIACIDCTGHGVPGAMISFIASEELYHLSETESSPAEILKKLNKRINKLFNNESEIGSEGMDLMLLKISKEKKCLTYAGAKSKAILIQNNTLTELITSKTSIGQRKQLDDNTFEEYELNYNQGDRLILFSDGYADQFCEEKKKRFGYKNFIEIIEENKTKNFETLKSALYDAHIKEKGNNKQTDDIQIIGISF